MTQKTIKVVKTSDVCEIPVMTVFIDGVSVDLINNYMSILPLINNKLHGDLLFVGKTTITIGQKINFSYSDDLIHDWDSLFDFSSRQIVDIIVNRYEAIYKIASSKLPKTYDSCETTILV